MQSFRKNWWAISKIFKCSNWVTLWPVWKACSLSGATRALWVGETHFWSIWGLLMCHSGIDNTTRNVMVCFGKVYNPCNDKLRTTMMEWLRGLICRYLGHYSPWHIAAHTFQWQCGWKGHNPRHDTLCWTTGWTEKGFLMGFSPGHYSLWHSVAYAITMYVGWKPNNPRNDRLYWGAIVLTRIM